MGQLAEGVNAFQKGLYSEAYTLLLPFAEQGEVRAQLILARLFYAGHGVQQSEEQYLYWLRRSADSGDKAAKSLIKRLDRGDVQPPFELGEAHVDFYRLFGYLHIPRFFMSQIMFLSRRFDAMANAEAQAEEGAAPGGSDDQEWLDELAHSPGLTDIARRLLGYAFQHVDCDAITTRSGDGFRYGSYHTQQTARQGLRAIACLDRGGAVGLFPGSQHSRDAFARSLRAVVDQGGNLAEQAAGHAGHSGESEIHLQAGDLLLWDLNLVHRLLDTGRELRLLGMEFTVQPTACWQLRRCFGR